MKAKEPNPKEATNVIANLILPKEDWQLGKTKIFLKVLFQFYAIKAFASLYNLRTGISY